MSKTEERARKWLIAKMESLGVADDVQARILGDNDQSCKWLAEFAKLEQWTLVKRCMRAVLREP